MNNLVLETTKVLMENPKYVTVCESKLEEIAKKFSKEPLFIPSWNGPVFLKGRTEEVIDFFMLANSINFAYTDFESHIEWSTEFHGQQWKGSFGVYAAIKKALENDFPIFNARYLKMIPKEDMERIFKGNIEIPMLEERTKILREVGQVLCDKYEGYFHNLVKVSNKRLFNNGMGIIERLTNEFSSFDDSVTYEDKLVVFDKKAQLACGLLYGRFRNKGLFKIKDINELTVFADYVLPQSLRDLGILVYEDSLAERVDNYQLIEPGSQEELEIRASTIHVSDRLIKKINNYRKNWINNLIGHRAYDAITSVIDKRITYKKNKINALHLDYKLRSELRQSSPEEKHPHHLTRTIFY